MLNFRKMHGLGNDFVILDSRDQDLALTPARVRAIGDRHFGVGFDQLVVLKTPNTDNVDLDIDFWNADGSMAGACGNASRCIGKIIMDETGRDTAQFRTERGVLTAKRMGDDISVNMGQPQLTWDAVPLAYDCDLNHLPIEGDPGAAGMGNPHMVFVVDDVAAVPLSDIGHDLEHHPLFPEKTNVEFIQVLARDHIRMRVWERGGRITLACGSGACAAAVVAHRRGLTERKVHMDLDGGPLTLDWRDDGIWMTGTTSLVFEGTFSREFLENT